MDFKATQHRLSQLASRFNLMVFLVFGLLMTNVLTASLAWYTSLHQKVEVTPFGASAGYTKSEAFVDASYLSLMSVNFVYSRLNITPETVAANHKRLLDFIDAGSYADIAAQLARESTIIKDKKISSHFEIKDIRSDVRELKTTITGTLIRYVGLRALKPEKLIYHIKYHYGFGRLTLTQFTHTSMNDKEAHNV